jgi:hypothetical protein
MRLPKRYNQEVSVAATRTPSAEHIEFDRVCAQVEEFDYLPDFSREAREVRETHDLREPEPADHRRQQTELDQLILAGLVSPM